MDADESGSPGTIGEDAFLNFLLPGPFLDFLEENELDPSIYAMTDTIPRYIRIKPACEAQLSEIEAELKCKLEKVAWLPGFFSMPPHIQIASSSAYQSGKIYGMDAASGAAVIALDVSPGDHVLDLCAAPGAKLCMVSDVLGNSGSLTGVDVSRHRLAACRTMLQKYELGDRCRLFVADGTKFSLLPLRSHADTKSCIEQKNNHVENFTIANDAEDITNVFTEWTSKRPWKERRKALKARNASGSCATTEPELLFYGRHSGVVGLRRKDIFHEVDTIVISNFGYDRVLVDAECTHDGSIKHIQKFEHWGWETLQRRVLDAKKTDNLIHLQLQLLNNGFRLLKVGGSLVYSTCSLTVAQNEGVVERFLSINPSAEVQVVDAAVNWCYKSGKIPKTLRFDPKTSHTSGLFITKLTKLAT